MNGRPNAIQIGVLQQWYDEYGEDYIELAQRALLCVILYGRPKKPLRQSKNKICQPPRGVV
jgi:hypothetical protein